MTDRTNDPAIDPLPGDAIRGKSGMLRTVIRIDGPSLPNPQVVFSAERNGAASQRKSEWLYQWRSWCKRNAVGWIRGEAP